MEPQEPRATFDESAETLERKSAREEAPVWGMLPLFAIIGAVVAMLVAFTPAARGGAFFFLLLSCAALLAGGAMLLWNHQRRRIK